MTEESEYIWAKETDPEKIKRMAEKAIDELTGPLGKLMKRYECNNEFLSLMVSEKTKAKVLFGGNPSSAEINRLINALRVQMEIYKEAEATPKAGQSE